MKPFALLLAVAFLCPRTALVSAQTAKSGDINLLPMYGGFEKSRALRKADAEFLAFCDQKFSDRRDAANQFAKRGWDYFYAGDPATAIKRYNQAWLLDSTNAAAYWGFGVIEGQRQHNTDALRYFQISLRLNPTNRRLLVDMAQALLSRFDATHYSPDLDAAISRLEEYLTDTSDAKATTDAYKKLAVAHFFKRDYANAWKYVDLTTALDATATHDWEFLPVLQKAAPR